MRYLCTVELRNTKNMITNELKVALAEKMVEHIEDNHGSVTTTAEKLAKKLLIVEKSDSYHVSVFYRSRRYFISVAYSMV